MIGERDGLVCRERGLHGQDGSDSSVLAAVGRLLLTWLGGE